MYMAMLAFKSKPIKKTLKRWDLILEATADYMASFAWFNQSSGRYDLGPPAIGVTENTPPENTLNLAGFAIRGGGGNTPRPFMPGNAGFLLAVAYMAKGWDGSKRDAPGFPSDDGWVVKHEGLPSSGKTYGDFALHEAAPLIFPTLDVAEADSEESKSSKQSLGEKRAYIQEYYDKRAQAQFALNRPDNLLANQQEAPEFNHFTIC
ncbi:six-hairpin glycosidase [Fusarium agapanthi]|uniref:Six-hairpin glycosidase n=1 Tax=Fusarium agapanthi TaxID=1803897 RepID=A0A9P5AWL4_9HYPO|nr:six-hairpin glycosidase [Fusarium agapanthi]